MCFFKDVWHYLNLVSETLLAKDLLAIHVMLMLCLKDRTKLNFIKARKQTLGTGREGVWDGVLGHRQKEAEG